jgi:hypothetical protein
MSDKGFIKLRRGLNEHLPRINSDAVKLYLRLLFLADWRKGKTHGLAQANFSEIATEFGWSPRGMRYATAALRTGGYITVERQGNQRSPSVVRIEKYDGASAKAGLSSDRASATNCLSTDELRQETGGAAATASLSSCLSTPATPFEIKRPEPPKKLEEVKSSSKNGAPEAKMYDPDDHYFSPTGKRWKRLGIGKLQERFRPFVELAEKMQPRLDETVASWCGRVIDACRTADIEYAPEFYAITQRYRKHDEPCFSIAQQIKEQDRRRGAYLKGLEGTASDAQTQSPP